MGGGGEKAHTKLRVPTHSPPPFGLPASISKKWEEGRGDQKFGGRGDYGDYFSKIHFRVKNIVDWG